MAERKGHIEHVLITVEGQELPTQIMDDLFDVTVETHAQLPDMFRIQLHDEQLRWIDEGPFAPGKAVEVSYQPDENAPKTSLIKGEITAVEPEFGEGTHAQLTVRGYDRSHRLHRGTHSRTYLQMTDSDIAQRIAREAKLQADVQPTSEVYEHVLQLNQSDMAFLAGRAQRIGFEVSVVDNTLRFRKRPESQPAIELEWGTELLSFRPRLTLAEQVDEVQVKGWDVKNRQAFLGRATGGKAAPRIRESRSGAQMASAAFGGARHVVVDRNIASQGEADRLAQAVFDELSAAFLEADGECVGDPRVTAGQFVNLGALGQRFSGTYFVTSATHVYRAEQPYATYFQVAGHRPGTLQALVEPAPAPGRDAVVGIVTNNKDPQDRGRVKVKFPWLADDIESHWARLVAPGGGPERGVYWLPEINDEVLVMFEQGDVNRPYVLGGLWNGRDKPAAPAGEVLQGGAVRTRILRTRKGHTLTFIDDGADEGIRIRTAGGHTVMLSDKDREVVVKTTDGHVFTLSDADKKLVAKSTGDMELTCQGNLKIGAPMGAIEIQGNTYKLSASATGEVKAGAKLTINGATVAIN